jgi:uncharacterized protein
VTLTASKYLLVSQQRYQDAAGRRVRLAYSARRPEVLVLGEETAARIESRAFDDIPAAELSRLLDSRAVVPAGEDELADVMAALRAGSTDPGWRDYCIFPTSFCNMECSYCGQEHVRTPKSEISFERLATRIEAAFADPSITRIGLGWFGGEPMLALPVMRELSARFNAAADAAGKTYTSTMPTNGSLLTRQTLRILHDECRMTGIDVTLDGPEQLHDQRRLKRNRVGSFRRTVNVLAEAVRDRAVPNMSIGLRMNIDVGNEDQVEELIADLACAGLAAPQVELHLYPVHAWADNDVSTTESQARSYGQREIRWLRLARQYGFRFMIMPGQVRSATCRATSRQMELVDYAGRVFSCTEHPLVPGLKDSGVVARVDDLVGVTPRPAGLYDDWYEQVEDGHQQCGRCPLLPVCGGSCPRMWREGSVPCPSVKFNWADRLDIAAAKLGLRAAR